MQLAFDKIQKEFAKLKLVLNASKTKVMLFSKARNTDLDSFQITLANGTQLEKVSEYKYLGLWIDEKLTFQQHVKLLSAKLRQSWLPIQKPHKLSGELQKKGCRGHLFVCFRLGGCSLPVRYSHGS